MTSELLFSILIMVSFIGGCLYMKHKYKIVSNFYIFETVVVLGYFVYSHYKLQSHPDELLSFYECGMILLIGALRIYSLCP